MDKRRIRKFFGILLKKSNLFQNIYNQYYLLRNKRAFLKMIEKRKFLSIFSWRDLIEPLPYCPLEKIKDSNYYGYVKSIKQYIGLADAKITIEHGLYLDDSVSYFSNFNTFDIILTFSRYRSITLKKHGVNKPILEIGPYIEYVTPLLSKHDIDELKQKYGKILLFMPSHSTNLSNGTSSEFEKDLEDVLRLKDYFNCDTVMACIYHRDFEYCECIEKYESLGFVLTTAGHQYDLNFASRLKSIIELSDYVAVNSIGTNLGFCVAMNKPVTYINLREDSFSNNLSGYSARKEIANAFSTPTLKVTKDQWDVVDKYWGVSCVRSPEKIREFLYSNTK